MVNLFYFDKKSQVLLSFFLFCLQQTLIYLFIIYLNSLHLSDSPYIIFKILDQSSDGSPTLFSIEVAD